MEKTSPDLQPGEILGSYKIVRLLGIGGMGRVYEAEHTQFHIRRALKVFACTSEHADVLRRKFLVEGRLLGVRLDHPRVVKVHDLAIDVATLTPYFAMDLVLSADGNVHTLRDEDRAGVSEVQVVEWFGDICAGLGYVHTQHVVHRDVSLDNILLDASGHAVLSDFGISRIFDECDRHSLDATVTIATLEGHPLWMGKGAYAAPELLRGVNATPASDAYALGVAIFRLLTGIWYEQDGRSNILDLLAGMEWNWDVVLGRLLSPNPAKRLGIGGVGALPDLLSRKDHALISPNTDVQPLCAFWRPWVIVLVLVVLVGVLMGGVLLLRARAQPLAKYIPDNPLPVVHLRKATQVDSWEKINFDRAAVYKNDIIPSVTNQNRNVKRRR